MLVCAAAHRVGPSGSTTVSIETRGAAMFAVQERAAQATDQIAQVTILGSLVIGIIVAVQAAALFAGA